MSPAATLVEALEPLRADPARAAVLLDVDGTLAPIVRHTSDAHVPEATRSLLIAVARRYGTVACVSGRPASVARRIVAIGSISYVGNHGAEQLRAGSTTVVLDPALEPWRARIATFVAGLDEAVLHRRRVRFEDKGPIAAFHWRGAPDEDAAREVLVGIEQQAREAKLDVHWGRKVLEVRPPLPIDKGRGIARLLADKDLGTALYVGDDMTDLDAFSGLRERFGAAAVCVGVRSEETPGELEGTADLMVEGPVGVRGLLEGLLR